MPTGDKRVALRIASARPDIIDKISTIIMKDKKATDFERELKIAYHKHATAKGISLIDKAFYKAYDGDTKMMIALLKKLVADKTEQKGTLVDQSQHDHYYSQVKVIIDDNPDIPPALKARLGLSRSE